MHKHLLWSQDLVYNWSAGRGWGADAIGSDYLEINNWIAHANGPAINLDNAAIKFKSKFCHAAGEHVQHPLPPTTYHPPTSSQSTPLALPFPFTISIHMIVPFHFQFHYDFDIDAGPRSAQIDQALPSNMSKIEICFLFSFLFFIFFFFCFSLVFAYLDIYWKGTDKHKSEQIIILAKCQHTETKKSGPNAQQREREGRTNGLTLRGLVLMLRLRFGLGGTGWQRDAADNGCRTPRQSWSIGHVFIFDLCVFIFMHACESGRS